MADPKPMTIFEAAWQALQKLRAAQAAEHPRATIILTDEAAEILEEALKGLYP